MPDIKLNFINNSNDINNTDIVVFQRNEQVGFSELAVAWKVIQNCGQRDHHPFVYPTESTVGACDSYWKFHTTVSCNGWATMGND